MQTDFSRLTLLEGTLPGQTRAYTVADNTFEYAFAEVDKLDMGTLGARKWLEGYADIMSKAWDYLRGKALEIGLPGDAAAVEFCANFERWKLNAVHLATWINSCAVLDEVQLKHMKHWLFTRVHSDKSPSAMELATWVNSCRST